DVLARQPQLAAYGTPALIELVIARAPDELAAAVEDALPRFDADLQRSALDLAKRLVDTMPADASREVQARRLDSLGRRAAEAGDLRDALAPAREAVDLYRRMVKTEPAHRPGLAA